jgi:hypothetical protein
VDSLDANAGGVLSADEKATLVGKLSPGLADANLRAEVLRAMAENAMLRARETNRAFVLMQYFGYLRKDPGSAPDADFSGYRF